MITRSIRRNRKSISINSHSPFILRYTFMREFRFPHVSLTRVRKADQSNITQGNIWKKMESWWKIEEKKSLWRRDAEGTDHCLRRSVSGAESCPAKSALWWRNIRPKRRQHLRRAVLCGKCRMMYCIRDAFWAPADAGERHFFSSNRACYRQINFDKIR